MSQKYSILFAPLDAVGHVNACISIAQTLRDRGHKVTFATPLNWKGKLQLLGFHEEVYATTETKQEDSGQVGDTWSQNVAKMAAVLSCSPIERHAKFQIENWRSMFEQIKYQHPRLKEIMDTVQPDVVVVDYLSHIPALMNHGTTPWIFLMSCNPIGISDVNVPPANSGYPTDGDREIWRKYMEEVERVYKNEFLEYKKWILENGGPELEFTYPYWMKYSPWANIYKFPLELDYTDLRPNPKNWFRFDGFVNDCAESFEIPANLRDRSGKLIYFSMGTIGSADVSMMKRLMSILAKSDNRFIVSKGPMGDEFELPENMWGLNSVAQTQILPCVDLVITHGGNNTISESFFFGTPLLVLPVLWDQLDSAQRIHECGLGLRFDPYKVTETELLEAIEQLLSNQLLKKRMRTISQRIRSSNSQNAVADLIEKVAEERKSEQKLHVTRCKIDIRSPETTEEWDDYYSLRYEVLRRPLGQPVESARVEDDDNSYHFAAFEHGHKVKEVLIGVVCVKFRTEETNSDAKSTMMQLRLMAVMDGKQGNGIGKQLVLHVEEFARKKGATKMFLEARENAVKFYEYLGYNVVKKSHLLFGKIQHYSMEKLL